VLFRERASDYGCNLNPDVPRRAEIIRPDNRVLGLEATKREAASRGKPAEGLRFGFLMLFAELGAIPLCPIHPYYSVVAAMICPRQKVKGMNVRHFLATSFLFIGLILPVVSAAQIDSLHTVATDSSAAAELTIRLSELADQTVVVSARVLSADALSTQAPGVKDILDDWEDFSAELDELVIVTSELANLRTSPEQLDELLRRWQVHREQAIAWSSILSGRIEVLNLEVSHLVTMRSLWLRTRNEAIEEGRPASTISQINRVVDQIDKVVPALRERLDIVLDIQSRLALKNSVGPFAIERLSKFRTRALKDRLSDLDTPIWRLFSGDDSADSAEGDSFRSVEMMRVVTTYLQKNLESLAQHLAFVVFLFFAFQWLSARLAEFAVEDKSWLTAYTILEKPMFPALLVGLISTQAFYSVPPAELVGASILLSVPVTLYLLYRHLPPSLHKMLYGIGVIVGLYVLTRNVFLPQSGMERFGLFLVAVATLGGAAWFLRPGGATDLLERTGFGRIVINAARLGFLLATLSFVADFFGYVQAAHHFTRSIVVGIYFGLYIYLGVQIVNGAFSAFVATRFAQRTHVIRNHTREISRKTARLANLAGGLYWSYLCLEMLGIFGPISDTVETVMTQPLGIREVTVSLIDIVVFIVTLWVSVKISQIIRALLDEDIMGRMDVSRGLSSAVSSLTFYALVAFGFLLAFSAAGLPLDRLVLVTGALSIGIGFGLQDVVKNFISGLILMLERPVKVGDTIDFGSQSGEIQKIGIRSSVVLGFEGNEVIVPNSHLVANEVTNWTMKNSSRRIDVDLTIDYESNNREVFEILMGVARDFEGIAADPAPKVLLTSFNEHGMAFSLRCWITDRDDMLGKKSELSAMAHERLRAAGVQFPAPPLQRDE